MPLTPRELNRATLARQLLLERSPLSVPDGVRQVVALQAQHPASPYVALWNRLGGFDPAGLDAAFAGRTVVKATLMRITLHAVHAEDYGPFRAAMQPTLYGARLGARFAGTGLTPADAARLLPGSWSSPAPRAPRPNCGPGWRRRSAPRGGTAPGGG